MELIKHAIVREPGPNFAQGVTTAGLGQPDFQKALYQHRNYCEALESCGVTLIRLPCDLKYPDCCFVEDTAVVLGDTAVITRPGHPARLGEEAAIEDLIAKHKKIVHIKEPGTVDGGDVLRIGRQYFIGLSDRSNRDGAEQLAGYVRAQQMSATVVPVHGLLHLKTGISCVGEDTIICVSELASAPEFDAVDLKIVVSESEKHAANCLLVNNTVLLPRDCPELKERIERLGKKVITIEITEFQKMDGGLSCLSIRF